MNKKEKTKVISIRVSEEVHSLYVKMSDQNLMRRRYFATELFVAALELYAALDHTEDKRKVLQ